MNKDKYLTVSIKQKAIKDKGKGTTLTAYNKKAEIANSSGKSTLKSSIIIQASYIVWKYI